MGDTDMAMTIEMDKQPNKDKDDNHSLADTVMRSMSWVS